MDNNQQQQRPEGSKPAAKGSAGEGSSVKSGGASFGNAAAAGIGVMPPWDNEGRGRGGEGGGGNGGGGGMAANVPGPELTPAAADALAAMSLERPSKKGKTAAGEFHPDAVEQLIPALRLLFQDRHVLTLDSISTLLRETGTTADLRRAGGKLMTGALEEAIKNTGKFELIHGAYVRKELGPAEMQDLRAVILELLKSTEQPVALSDVEVAAEKKGVPYDFEYCYVVMQHELCDDWLDGWKIKDGALE